MSREQSGEVCEYHCVSDQVSSEESDALLLQSLQHKLVALRGTTHDITEWHRAQSKREPLPSELVQAADNYMDKISAETIEICDRMAKTVARSITTLKYKASALEYLLPEDSDHHVDMCRSICADIRRL